jgi:hypothetical protein
MSRIPGETEPYVTRLPRTEKTERMLRDTFVGSLARPSLCALYLNAGKYMPDLAKKRGAFIGLCDATGMKAGSETATHIGFTAGDLVEMEPLPAPAEVTGG